MASDETRAAIRDDLTDIAGRGAGLVELLGHLRATNDHLGRRARLSDDQLDELSLYCWRLSRTESTVLVCDRARDLWTGLGTRAQARRPRPRVPSDSAPPALP